ncbi:MAG: hypothetical protein ACYSU5_26055 [Planctomycetota bacterium]|jgi:hypothetical protein
MGDIITEPVKTVTAVVAVKDPDTDDQIVRIDLFEDGVIVQTDQPNSNRRQWKKKFGPKHGKHYYFVKVTQKDGNMMWSAPVWVKVGED